jgi:hypothetical protein
LTPLGWASIRAAEQGLQTQGYVDEVIPGTIGLSMRKEFESILASDLDFLFENGHPEMRPAFRALPRAAELDALDPVRFDSLDFCDGLSESDAESFSSWLEEELPHTLEDQLG